MSFWLGIGGVLNSTTSIESRGTLAKEGVLLKMSLCLVFWGALDFNGRGGGTNLENPCKIGYSDNEIPIFLGWWDVSLHPFWENDESLFYL